MALEHDCSDPLDEARRALIEGEIPRAQGLLTALSSRHSGNPAIHHLLALAQAADRRYRQAIESLQQALQIDAAQWRWRMDLGTVYSAAGEWSRAAEQFARALEQAPEEPRALLGYGKAALEARDFEKAAACYQKILHMESPSVSARCGLAKAFIGQERFDEADQLLKEALAADPGQIEYLRLLATVYSICGESELAREYWERVATLAPHDLSAVGALVYQSWQLGDLDATLAHARRIIDTGCATVDLHSFYLYLLLYSDKETAESIKTACEAFGQTIERAHAIEFPSPRANSEGRLRIGYLTGEFMGGPAFYFLSSLLGNHDPEAVEVFCYHTRRVLDDRTMWFQQFGHWRDCRGISDELIRRQIREDGIDILVDLSGFFPDHRLAIFAGRAAPVQATYPNCPITTGVSQIDYIFTDIGSPVRRAPNRSTRRKQSFCHRAIWCIRHPRCRRPSRRYPRVPPVRLPSGCFNGGQR
jgi:predicted O-linked N-acetylglucosamine transferase (SPINDLY family)